MEFVDTWNEDVTDIIHSLQELDELKVWTSVSSKYKSISEDKISNIIAEYIEPNE